MAKYRLKKSVKRNLTIVVSFVCIGVVVLLFVFNPFKPKRVYATEGVTLNSVDGIEVIEYIIEEGKQNRPLIDREIKLIVIHETDNFDFRANAQKHAEYLYTNETDVNSWHYTVDEESIYHHLPDHEVGWHAGDQMTEDGGNMTGIGIEMCVNDGNDFDETIDNTAKLVARLLFEYNLTIEDVRRHQDFSGKWCPAHLLDDDDWNSFLEKIENYYKKL